MPVGLKNIWLSGQQMIFQDRAAQPSDPPHQPTNHRSIVE
jgi:hypothetical protein